MREISSQDWEALKAKMAADYQSGVYPQCGIDRAVRVDLGNGDFQLVDRQYLPNGEPFKVVHTAPALV